MSSTASATNRQAGVVAAASEQTSTNVQAVASATEELSSSIAEIGRQVTQSTEIAARAVEPNPFFEPDFVMMLITPPSVLPFSAE